MTSTLADYRTLGRSGLKVSPLCLGTMTFGTDWGWGADDATSRALFRRYVEAGGNFVDTADLYVGGKSEEMLGRFMAEDGVRDRLVVATKYSYNAEPGNPNAGGNGRKNLLRALEGSLRRLRTDYVDLLWLHSWDVHTPPDEVLRTFDTVVRSGRVRYVGLSDVPAWYMTRLQTLAEASHLERIIALQPEYSLVERTVEREHLPAAASLGIGVTPWSPLASGFLSGKYVRGAVTAGRLETVKGSGNPVFEKFSDRNWGILDVVREVAAEAGSTPARVSLAWLRDRPRVTSILVGATRPEQLSENLAALSLSLTDEQRTRLDTVSALPQAHPYALFGPTMQAMLTGGVTVRGFDGRSLGALALEDDDRRVGAELQGTSEVARLDRLLDSVGAHEPAGTPWRRRPGIALGDECNAFLEGRRLLPDAADDLRDDHLAGRDAGDAHGGAHSGAHEHRQPAKRRIRVAGETRREPGQLDDESCGVPAPHRRDVETGHGDGDPRAGRE